MQRRSLLASAIVFIASLGGRRLKASDDHTATTDGRISDIRLIQTAAGWLRFVCDAGLSFHPSVASAAAECYERCAEHASGARKQLLLRYADYCRNLGDEISKRNKREADVFNKRLERAFSVGWLRRSRDRHKAYRDDIVYLHDYADACRNVVREAAFIAFDMGISVPGKTMLTGVVSAIEISVGVGELDETALLSNDT